MADEKTDNTVPAEFNGKWIYGNNKYTAMIEKDRLIRDTSNEPITVISSNVIQSKWCNHHTILVYSDYNEITEIGDSSHSSIGVATWKRDKYPKHHDNTIKGRWIYNNGEYTIAIDDNFVVFRENMFIVSEVIAEGVLRIEWSKYGHWSLLVLQNDNTMIEMCGSVPLKDAGKWIWKKQ
eukprot:362238_1